MKKNRLLVCFIAIALCAFLMTGCGKSESTASKSDKISVVCTTFPQFDWVKQLIKGQEDQYQLTLLLDKGTDLHSYQPTAEDMVKISDCDVFIYVGGESDGWVDDALKEAKNKDLKAINMMETLGDTVKEEEVKEGMEAEEEEEEGEGEEIEYDEHVWLSLKNAQVVVKEIAKVLSDVDSNNANTITENEEKYVADISSLDCEYEEAVQSATNKTVLFGDRFPFRYMMDDYNLDYYAAFVGCSAETEASFETIAFLSKKIDELDLPVVFVIEKSNKKIANSIINNTETKDQKILTMNSLQSITGEDEKSGVTYLDVMKENLTVLKEALN